MELEYLRVRDDAAWSEVRAIRQVVYVEEQEIPAALEWDAFDATSEHRLLRRGGTAVACARWRWTDVGVARLERIAVLAEERGRGLGREVVRRALAELDTEGARRVEISAQAHLERFYGAFGFEVTGDAYLEAGIEHLPMARGGAGLG